MRWGPRLGLYGPGLGIRESGTSTEFSDLISVDPRPMPMLVPGSRRLELKTLVLVSGFLATHAQVISTQIVYIY